MIWLPRPENGIRILRGDGSKELATGSAWTSHLTGGATADLPMVSSVFAAVDAVAAELLDGLPEVEPALSPSAEPAFVELPGRGN